MTGGDHCGQVGIKASARVLIEMLGREMVARRPMPPHIALRRAKLRRRYSINQKGACADERQVIEAVAASNSLRAAPVDNTERRLDGRERYVVGHNRLAEAFEGERAKLFSCDASL